MDTDGERMDYRGIGFRKAFWWVRDSIGRGEDFSYKIIYSGRTHSRAISRRRQGGNSCPPHRNKGPQLKVFARSMRF